MFFCNRFTRVFAAMLVCGGLSVATAQSGWAEVIAKCRNLAEAGDVDALVKFVESLQDFDSWLGQTKTKTAVEWLQQAANADNPVAKVALGKCYAKGYGVGQNELKAFSLYKSAAEKGDAEAQCMVFECYRKGEGVIRDEAKALEWLLKAAEQGYAKAMYMMGIFYIDGGAWNRSLDFSKGEEWLQKAAERGYPEAQYELGLYYLCNLDVPKRMNINRTAFDIGKGIMWLGKAAGQGHDEAQYQLGRCYASTGVQHDMAKAAEWYLKAANQNHWEAQYELGLCYFKGEGVSQNKAEAVKWWRESSCSSAKLNLAKCYLNGEVVQKDEKHAVSILREIKFMPEAAFLLGKCYFYGYDRDDDGMILDKDWAIQLFVDAANAGYAPAQCTLAKCYEKGDGVPKDMEEAKKWYGLASEKDFAEADEALMRLGMWH